MTSLRIQVNNGAVMAHQTVAVIPQSKYRLTGWIRTQDVQPDTKTEELAGACLGIVDRDVVSESVNGTSDWKQITWEFDSNDATTLTIGCRLGHDGSTCTGAAWFDDLVLEKLE